MSLGCVHGHCNSHDDNGRALLLQLVSEPEATLLTGERFASELSLVNGAIYRRTFGDAIYLPQWTVSSPVKSCSPGVLR